MHAQRVQKVQGTRGVEDTGTPWQHVEHGFGPLVDPDSTRLFLGTMASPKSREAGFFYMHPRNRFWPIMEALFADPNNPEDTAGTTKETRAAFAHRHHLALWDTLESCDIQGASDSTIRNVVPSDLVPIIQNSKITHIYPTGAKAAQLYRKYCAPPIADAGLTVTVVPLPSTSPAYAAKSLEQLTEIYRERMFGKPEPKSYAQFQ